jgi:predicted RNase H-like HicB family nuclease
MINAMERKPLKYYLELNYPVTLHPAPEGGFVAEIEDLPGCLAQGDAVNKAYKMIEIARKMWIEVAYEDGQNIPLPRTEAQYSGKFNVRFPRSLHRKLDQLADREGVSLNQYLVATLSHAVGLNEGKSHKLRKSRS